MIGTVAALWLVAASGVVDPALEAAGRVAGAEVATVVVANVGLFLAGLHRGWIVLGRELDEIRRERDWWRGMTVRALDLGEAAVARRQRTDEQ